MKICATYVMTFLWDRISRNQQTESSMKTVNCFCMAPQMHLMKNLCVAEVAFAIIQMHCPEVYQDLMLLRVFLDAIFSKTFIDFWETQCVLMLYILNSHQCSSLLNPSSGWHRCSCPWWARTNSFWIWQYLIATLRNDFGHCRSWIVQRLSDNWTRSWISTRLLCLLQKSWPNVSVCRKGWEIYTVKFWFTHQQLLSFFECEIHCNMLKRKSAVYSPTHSSPTCII